MYEDQAGRIRYLDVTYCTEEGQEKLLMKYPLSHFAPLEMTIEKALNFARNPAKAKLRK
jgi:hypothetical protein